MADLERKERCKRLATLRKRAERDREDINKKNAIKEKDKERKKRQRLNESNLENTQTLIKKKQQNYQSRSMCHGIVDLVLLNHNSLLAGATARQFSMTVTVKPNQPHFLFLVC